MWDRAEDRATYLRLGRRAGVRGGSCSKTEQRATHERERRDSNTQTHTHTQRKRATERVVEREAPHGEKAPSPSFLLLLLSPHCSCL